MRFLGRDPLRLAKYGGSLTYQTKWFGIKMEDRKGGGSLHRLEAIERLQNMSMPDMCDPLSGLMPNVSLQPRPPRISSLAIAAT